MARGDTTGSLSITTGGSESAGEALTRAGW